MFCECAVAFVGWGIRVRQAVWRRQLVAAQFLDFWRTALAPEGELRAGRDFGFSRGEIVVGIHAVRSYPSDSARGISPALLFLET